MLEQNGGLGLEPVTQTFRFLIHKNDNVKNSVKTVEPNSMLNGFPAASLLFHTKTNVLVS